MSRFLLIDVGAGTMDVLFYDDQARIHYKAVVKSPVRLLAERVDALPGDLLVTGGEMGGGPISEALIRRAQSARVVMSASAAATVHHDPDRVRARGIEIVEDARAVELREDPGFQSLILADVDAERLQKIVATFGLPFEFDLLGICVQDHGVAPTGTSHLDYRHQLFSQRLGDDPHPHALLYAADEVPETLNRCRSVAADAQAIPASEIYVMDSGMAAILGATQDPMCKSRRFIQVLDVATSHTVGAAFDRDDLAGFFEYHTRDISAAKLDRLCVDLADGRLSHEQILAEGGHGAYIQTSFGFKRTEIILATGPQRSTIKGSKLNIVPGAPFGDNMMTGTTGLLEAIRRRKKMGALESP